MSTIAERPAVSPAPQQTHTGNTRPRVLSGVKPTGSPHLGNYLGAIKRWVDMQDQYENFFCVVDLHAITEPQDAEKLRRTTREVAALYFAAGIDPVKSTVFIQSHVPAHAELGWILNCITPMGWLERMTQYKDRSAKLDDNKERISTGLFDYPVLMAADILLYQAHFVPVGEDQKQHVELTRNIAERFNRLYGDTFVVPEPLIGETGARIMSLVDPSKKMSKSDDIPGAAIGMFDEPDVIRKSIMRATTDSAREIRFDPQREAIYNLLSMYEILSGESRPAIERRFEGKGYGDFKRDLADLVLEKLGPIHRRAMELVNSDELDILLKKGAEQAAPIADRTLRQVKYAMGFIV
jgi:tryptophanyl-tRNA synthetase